jgi:GTP-binding protein
VALVGFPNAGKSTLISRISAARPKIADYPFTTLEPHLGVVSVEPGAAPPGSPPPVSDFVVADVPGLVEGASEGRGLGHRFLRHIERARVLAILIDLAPDEGRPIDYQLEVLLAELGRHQPALLARPRLVVGSRVDLRRPAETPEISGELAATAEALAGGETAGAAVVSAVTGRGVAGLVGRLAALVGEARAAEQAEAGQRRRAPAVLRPAPEGVTVERVNGELVVRGRAAERAVALSDLTDLDALEVVRRRLRRLGVDRALARAGARDGDPVRVGSMSFTYHTDS